MKKSTKKLLVSLTTILITSIVTSLLTFLCSYYLMFSQLEQEQTYWSTRMKTERLQELLNRQIVLYEEINREILAAEVLAKDVKISSAALAIEIEINKNSEDSEYNGSSIDLPQKALDYHKHLYDLGAKIQMAEYYFADGVDSLILPLMNSLEKNYQNNLILNDFPQLSSLDTLVEYFQNDFNTVENLTNIRSRMLKAMRKEINENTKIIYSSKE